MQNYVTRPQLHRNDGRTLLRSGKGNCPAAIHAVWPSRTSGGTTSIVAHTCGGIMFCADKRKASHGLLPRCVFTAPPLANFLLLYGSLKLAHVQPFRLLRAPRKTSDNKKSPSEERDFCSVKINYLIILETTPEPTVWPPSRIAKRRPSSIAMGVINVTLMWVWSPGITISTPSSSSMVPVTSVVRK